MTATAFTPEQEDAIRRRGSRLFVHAGAGSGKTRVLVERFVQAVLAGEAGVDRILAITFTEKAAAELRLRVRARFLELGEREHARAAEGAWVSTIHGFCSRLLRAHPFAAGIDPEFRVLDDAEAGRLRLDAFEQALEDFIGEGTEPARLELVAAHRPDGLSELVRSAYATLRSRGEPEPELPEIAAPGPGGERDALALRRYEGLRELVRLYGRRCTALKRDRSGLDFEDLELLARGLLEHDAALRARHRRRFAHVLVDELQDTNGLQNDLLGLISRDGENLFTVGDELQSIYAFRNADVEVFRAGLDRARERGEDASVAVNFRTRREILDVLDAAFGQVFGDRFQPLVAAGDAARGKARVSPSVELIVVDNAKARWTGAAGSGPEPFGATMRMVTPWRAAEARLLARRIDELTGERGPFEPGDVAVLLRAAGDMGVYERALAERGIPTYVAGGRGYWGQQQVADLRAHLAALANPLDEVALCSLLASPLVGASLDALALVGAACGGRVRDAEGREGARRGVWATLTGALPPDGDDPAGLADSLPPEDRDRLARFARTFGEERRLAPRLSLETLIDRAVTRSGYDRAVLSLPAGERRLANVRKLMRLAREFEAEEGRDLRGFIDFIDEQDLFAQEGEAPLEAEGIDAVRLMTIHAAKGLEFGVVCVADLGRRGKDDRSALRITQDGRVGLRLASIGGRPEDALDLERIKEEETQRGDEEERRIFYVAMTRAREHLVLSGAADLERRPEPAPLGIPMDWVWRAVAGDFHELIEGAAEGVCAGEYEGRETRVRCVRCAPDTVDELLPAEDRAPSGRRRPRARPPTEGPRLAPVADTGARALTHLSYTALEQHKRCGYRFYLERVLGMRALDASSPVSGDGAAAGGPAEAVLAGEEAVAAGPPGSDELPALVRGRIVHELLERLDFARPEAPSRAEAARRIEASGEAAGGADAERIVALVEGFAGSALCGRLASAARVRAELPFAFPLEAGDGAGPGLLVTGVVDAHAVEPDRLLIVDYKTDRLEDREPAELCEERYATQRLVYALAGLRSGAERVEVVHCFLERPDAPASATFEAGDRERLERELAELAAGVAAGRFEPTGEPHGGLCRFCPGQPALCSWGPERTLA